MITLYTSNQATQNSGKNVIKSVSLTFDKLIYNLEVTSDDKEAMLVIDSAKYLENGMIETPFGRTEVQNLSSGCKTLILLNHRKELGNPIINIGECGKNVLDYIFKMDNIDILLEFMLSPYNYDAERVVKVVRKNGSKQSKLREAFGSRWQA